MEYFFVFLSTLIIVGVENKINTKAYKTRKYIFIIFFKTLFLCYQSDEMKINHAPEWEPNPQLARIKVSFV